MNFRISIKENLTYRQISKLEFLAEYFKFIILHIDVYITSELQNTKIVVAYRDFTCACFISLSVNDLISLMKVEKLKTGQ